MAEYNRVIDYIIEQADRYDIKNLQFEEDIKFNLGRTTDNYYSRIVGKVLTDITSAFVTLQLVPITEFCSDIKYSDYERYVDLEKK